MSITNRTDKELIPELIPKYLYICGVCKGTGEKNYEYCHWCNSPLYFNKSLGYSMKDGTEVPMSVINQIEIAHKKYYKLQNLLTPK